MARMSIRDEVRAVPAYRFQARPHRVKLDQNEAPEDLDPALKARALERAAAADWHRYPELQADGVARRLAARDGWDPAGVVVAPGSNVLIQALIVAAGLGRAVATVAPTFAVYGAQARLLGAELREVPLRPDGFGLDVPGLEAALADGPGVLFLADPAAPTGNRLDDADVERVLEAAEAHDWTVVLDEAYWPYDGRHRLASLRGRRDRLSLRTFSKADGLAGARLGYALAHPDTARELEKVLLPFRLSALQAAVAEVVLDDPGAQAARERRVALARRERERVRARLAALPGVRVVPSATNFLLFRAPDAAGLYGELLERGVLVRRQDHLPGLAGCLRVTIGAPAENDAFLDAARAALGAGVAGG
jgi:histidinol-phosphate aminotransferase